MLSWNEGGVPPLNPGEQCQPTNTHAQVVVISSRSFSRSRTMPLRPAPNAKGHFEKFSARSGSSLKAAASIRTTLEDLPQARRLQHQPLRLRLLIRQAANRHQVNLQA